jgi:hypothetical protein
VATKTAKRRAGRRPPPTRVRRFVTWLSQTHPIARAVVGLVAPIATILGLLLAFGVMSPAKAEDRLAAGVDRLKRTTSEVRLAVRADVDGETISFTASGAYDYRSRRGWLKYQFAGVPGLETEIDVEGRFIERTAFIQLPANARTEGAPAWVQIDPAGIEKLLHDIGDAGIAPAATQELTVLADVSVADPYGVMEQLKAAGEPEKVGEDEPFGVPTEMYRGVLAVPGGRPLSATAWIDDDDLIRKLALRAGDSSGVVAIDLDFGPYGDPVDVVKPRRVVLASTLYARRAASF